MSTLPQCDWFDCSEPVCDEDMELTPPSKRYCQRHSDELKGYIETEDVSKIMSFWARSFGSADCFVTAMNE